MCGPRFLLLSYALSTWPPSHHHTKLLLGWSKYIFDGATGQLLFVLTEIEPVDAVRCTTAPDTLSSVVAAPLDGEHSSEPFVEWPPLAADVDDADDANDDVDAEDAMELL